MPLHNFILAQPTLTGLLTTLLPVLVQFALFLRWLHRRMREDEIVHACVRDIALTHLLHIYTTLQAIGAKQGSRSTNSPSSTSSISVAITAAQHNDCLRRPAHNAAFVGAQPAAPQLAQA
jgi:hypothetical protein